MRRLVQWIWQRGIVSTFMAGLVAVLPVVITFGIMNWVATWIHDAIGEGSVIGRALRAIGLKFATNDAFATTIGWLLVIAGIWGVGVVIRWTATDRVLQWFHKTMKRIPLIKSVYGPVQQVVAMFAERDDSEMAGMSVVYCRFGSPESAGLLGLLASPESFQFEGEPCNMIYFPSAPVPMTGYTLFVPTCNVLPVEMDVEALMQVYLSLGVMAGSAVPAKYQPKHPQTKAASRDDSAPDAGKQHPAD